jgi:4-amino-4-deoxy-L-arabinose transferase-like glycosyltransferase
MRSKKLYTVFPHVFLFLILLSTFILRMRLLDVPLERDEGEYAYMGQLILQGTPPYTEAYNMKFPGIYFLYAGIVWLFGETHTGIHFCLLLVNLLSIVLLYVFARKAYDDWTAAAAAGAFALLSMSYHVQGFWANAEHFVLPFIISAYLFLLLSLKKNRIVYTFISAILFGCSALVKQHGAFFGILGFLSMLVLLWQTKAHEKKTYWKYMGAFMGGVLLPLLVCFFYLAYAGVLHNFYLWTFAYAREYTSLVQTMDIQYYFVSSFFPLWQHTTLIWIVAGVGFIALFAVPQTKLSNILNLGFFIASMIALSIGFYFRPHYFVLILPSVSMLFGIGARFIFQFFSMAKSFVVRFLPPIIIIALAFLGSLAAHWDVLVQASPARVTIINYGYNPFPYSQMIANIIKEKTGKEDRIAIIGSEPQFLFYSQRRSATSFIYTFSLTEDQPFAEQFRREMIHQIVSAKPKLLVFTHVVPEWYGKSKGELEINTWFFPYADSLYLPVARFEYSTSTDTMLITDPSRLAGEPTHMFWISVYEKQHSK